MIQKEGPKPLVRLSNDFKPTSTALGAAGDLRRLQLHLSVSHDADLMVAYVVAEVLT